MVQQADSDVLHADFEMARGVEDIVRFLRPRISTLPFNMHFFSLLTPIDSSNVTASDWVNLATLVQEQMNNYQGFVILHGTNTCAYSASAMSFLLSNTITKPIIFTGSEVPISVQNTDAIHNVENAIRAAAWQSYNGPMRVPEVCVYWNNHLYRGSRVTKKYASDRTESFHTPNMAIPLATLANEKLNVDHTQIFVPSDSPDARSAVSADIADIGEPTVDVMFIHPDMDLDDMERKYPDTLDGLILLSYGPGNAPEDPRFISMLKRLIAHGTIIGNVTQCPYGGVELKLFETSAALFDLGVVDAYDMTLEAAYTKLLWAIARRGTGRQPGVQESVRRTFQRNIAGEMSASIYDASFGPSEAFYRTPRGEYLVSDVRRLDRLTSRYDIAEVFVRVEGMRFEAARTVGRVRLIFGRAADGATGGASEENLLADFTKTLTQSEAREGCFDKNLEVTHSFRKLFGNDEFQVSIGVEGATEFRFSSLRLVVYARRARSA
jgi:L-asparaginase